MVDCIDEALNDVTIFAHRYAVDRSIRRVHIHPVYNRPVISLVDRVATRIFAGHHPCVDKFAEARNRTVWVVEFRASEATTSAVYLLLDSKAQCLKCLLQTKA